MVERKSAIIAISVILLLVALSVVVVAGVPVAPGVPADRPSPRFTGVTTYLDPQGRFSFRYPTDWHRYEFDGRDAIMFAPNDEDLDTAFTVWTVPLERRVTAGDGQELKRAVDEAMTALEGLHIEVASEAEYGTVTRFERVMTFRDGSATRKRKLWLMNADRWLIGLSWQGSTEEEYEHWLPMANYSFATFGLSPDMWCAADAAKLRSGCR